MKNYGISKDDSDNQDLPSEETAGNRGKFKDRELNPYSVAGGRAMKRLRESKNLGQGEAALEANFSLSYLSNVERGGHALSLNKFMSFSDGIHSCPEELCRLLCEEIAKCREKGEFNEENNTAAFSGDICNNPNESENGQQEK